MLKKTLAIASLSVVLAGGSASSAIAAPRDFMGNWVNANSNTRGITRLVISSRGGNRLNIRVFGKCHPRDCNWGTVVLNTYGNNVSVRDKAATARYSKRFANTLLILRLYGRGHNQIRLQSFTLFKDGALHKCGMN